MEKKYYTAVREDVEEEKIYCNDYDGAEWLLADFNVKSNDKMTLYSYTIVGGLREQEVKVDQIDSILVDSQYRKQVNVSFDSPFGEHNVSFVEGIGSKLQGLFFAFDFWDEEIIDGRNMPILHCFHIDDILVYENPGQLIQSGLVSDNSINVSLLNQGIYYIVLRKDNEVYANKFIRR